MARSLNRAQLIGNLGRDPELRSTPSGKSVCTISVATTESYKNSNGEWQDNTEWHRVILWDRLADVAAQYLKQGSKVFIEGRIKTRSYEQEGITKYTTEIVAINMIMMGSGSGSGSGDSYPSAGNSGSSSNTASESKSTQGNYDQYQVDSNDSEDDDIPF